MFGEAERLNLSFHCGQMIDTEEDWSRIELAKSFIKVAISIMHLTLE